MFRKELFVFDANKPKKCVIRNYHESDFDDLIQVQRESFPPPFPSELWWNKEQLHNHVSLFPEGALCVEIDGKICGSMTGLIVQFNPSHPEHTWEEITDNGYIQNHTTDGNTLYIVDICISPAFRKYGLGKWLMQSMYEVVVHLKLERLLGGGRMSGYSKHAIDMSAQTYMEKVVAGELKDPVITFLLRCGRTPVQLIENYLDDEESCNYGLLMEWKNPFGIDAKKRV
ncbi:GNAT family N-acetyltransferase [Bacillus sp. REN16]|uniref:GNAT family N-acetyltransferase n=1 Tax=Bacillus sp. REN16 TaxID=2887296 RepID=UPI001E618085|nr:GNAT family N-acetyltransferase [Bacillus sp. REN16]MCC3357663.1 GNAT family N-acetyltransferase [Bacillus sp. REN16]